MHKSILIILISVLYLFSGCKLQPKYSEKEITILLDNWHQAAAEADLQKYFSFMTENAGYIGTDPLERWTRQEFYEFCQPCFEKGTIWVFKAFNQKIYPLEDYKTIWFDDC